MNRIPDLPRSIAPAGQDMAEYKMWVGIRSGLIGIRESLKFAPHNPSAALGMIYPALGRMISAIEERFELRESAEPSDQQDQSNPPPQG